MTLIKFLLLRIIWLITGSILFSNLACSGGGSSSGSTAPSTGAPVGPVLPTLSMGNSSAAEGGSLVFTVTLSAVSKTVVTANYQTVSGTAVAGEDFTSASGTVTIPIGQTTATLTVITLDNALAEGTETFSVTLSNPTNATLQTASGVGTVTDTDVSSDNFTYYSASSFETFTTARRDLIAADGFTQNSNNCKLPTEASLLKASAVLNKYFSAIKSLSSGQSLTVSNALNTELNNNNLKPFVLTSNGVTYYGLEEKAPRLYGFGFLLIKKGYSEMTKKLAIEIPHPIHDSNTPSWGGEVMDELTPAIYIQSGVHRYCSTKASSNTYPGNYTSEETSIKTDPAHETISFFHTAHTVLTESVDYAIQLHGFGSSQTSLYQANPPIQVVLTGGQKGAPPAVLTTLQTRLTAQSVNAKIFPSEVESLGAQTNVQGADVRGRLGAKFIHIESATELRSDKATRQKLVIPIKESFL